ncbi:T9SS type A sorting domain-containing protein [Adhaeribacter sp. BT258]|uniref:T9SS type A sorting domain-containing protein n=1 Tax=Adhaeribacter terrigena TaxID=2793070 RepID=A0ABS1C288_9BACT|nr:T9SS type A sorting domain-containing protein [Adhaeribacter terrigena]MBK0403512.1 T9SS type A sorting domain-containing protein [Adhaeribacter terrigena]
MKKRYNFLPENWLRMSLAAAFVAFFSLNSFAQNGPAIMWQKAFGGTNLDVLCETKQTSDGGFIIGGWSLSDISIDKSQNSKGFADYWIIKLDANGNKVWDKTLGGNGGDYLSSVKQTPDGGYILGGESGSGISGDKTQACKGYEDYWIIKLDTNGNKIWDKTYGGINEEEIGVIEPTIDGGYIVGGQSNSGISGDKTEVNRGSGYDLWIIKLDANGNKLWDKTLGSSSTDNFTCIQQTKDGGYILGGYSYSGISGDKTQASRGGLDYWVIKLDANGNKLWDKTFGGSTNEVLASVQQTTDGGYIIGGGSGSGIGGDKSHASHGCGDFWVLKLNATGNKIWDRTYGGSGCEGGGIIQIADGTYILSGPSDSGISIDKTQASRGETDTWLLKLDSSGNKTWDKTLGGTEEDFMSVFQQTFDGGYIIGGSSDSPISGDKTQAPKGDRDFWVIKIGGNPLGIKEPETNFAISISPNPNQGKFTLQLSNLTAPKAEVTVSDMLGRVVLQQELNVSNNQLSEELSLPHAKGMYLLQVKAGEQLLTRKIVVE